MPNINIDIDLEDIYWELNSRDKKTLLHWLQEDDIAPDPASLSFPEPTNYLDYEWEEMITKLAMNRHVFSTEEFNVIKDLCSKL